MRYFALHTKKYEKEDSEKKVKNLEDKIQENKTRLNVENIEESKEE